MCPIEVYERYFSQITFSTPAKKASVWENVRTMRYLAQKDATEANIKLFKLLLSMIERDFLEPNMAKRSGNINHAIALDMLYVMSGEVNNIYTDIIRDTANKYP